MRQLRQDPSKSAYEVLEGPYDWNRFPLAPVGSKAVIWESPKSRAAWQPRGTDAWYLGLSKDHYHCAILYLPETSAYCISVSFEVFPQHCQVPDLRPAEHMQELKDEIVETLGKLKITPRIKQTLTKLSNELTHFLTPRKQRVAAPTPIQRVVLPQTSPLQEEEEREKRGFQRVSDSPRITTSNNPTVPRLLKKTPRTHRRTKHVIICQAKYH